VKLIGPSKAILYSFAEPLTAAVISTLVLGSTFTPFDALGFAMIFIMLWLITVSKSS
jgi:drug/metabolite transporter (DMT)-like permease